MVTFGCWNRRFLLQNKNFNWGMLLVKNGDNKINASDPRLSVSQSCPSTRMRPLPFIEFMTNTENSAEISYSDYLFPVRESSLEDPRFSSPKTNGTSQKPGSNTGQREAGDARILLLRMEAVCSESRKSHPRKREPRCRP